MSDFTDDVDWFDFDGEYDAPMLDITAINSSYAYWKPKNEAAIKITDMKDSHLSNTIKYLEDVCMGNRPEYLRAEDRMVYLMNMKLEQLKRKMKGAI